MEKLKAGDIIYTDCIGSELCYHMGIIYKKNKIDTFVFHNAPTNNNKYGGTVVCERYEEFIKYREIRKILRTGKSNEDILRVAKKCRKEVWDSLFFNCEDFVLEIVEGHRKSKIRDAWKLAAIGVALLSLL